MPTLKDVAAQAGVSTSTAAAALRGETTVKSSTKERVFAAAQKIGYTANLTARNLKKGRTGVISVLIPDFRLACYINMALAIEKEANRQGLRVIIQQTGSLVDNEDVVLQQITSTPCDGIILNIHSIRNPRLRNMLLNHPTVLLNYDAEQPEYDTVRFPYDKEMSLAFGYLLRRGARRVAIIGAYHVDSNNPDTAGQQVRVRHALQAIKKHHLGDENDIIPCGWEIKDGIELSRMLCEASSDTGLRLVDQYDTFYCTSDLTAYGLIRGFHNQNIRIPEDKAVFGHGRVFSDPFTIPTLSTVSLDHADMAHKSVTMLLDQINHPNIERRIQVETADCKLIAGESA